MLAMVLHPDVQRRAQAELDAVVGPHRLPDFRDRADLPYLDRIITEVHRWYTVQPLAQQHRASDDISYRGYTIPKGATITPNVWCVQGSCFTAGALANGEHVRRSVLRSEETYGPDAHKFVPDRFLRPGLLGVPRGFPSGTFGYGRR
jgi:cytochrome P450